MQGDCADADRKAFLTNALQKKPAKAKILYLRIHGKPAEIGDAIIQKAVANAADNLPVQFAYKNVDIGNIAPDCLQRFIEGFDAFFFSDRLSIKRKCLMSDPKYLGCIGFLRAP